MIRSMTGYGQGSAEVDGVRARVEVRSVNHRFVDLRLRGPAELQPRERELRRRILDRVSRGRVEVNVVLERERGPGGIPSLNRAVVEAILAAAVELERDYGVTGELDRCTVLSQPGVLAEAKEPAELDEPELGAVVQALEAALESFDEDRNREGRNLAADVAARLQDMQGRAGEVRTLASRVPEAAKAKLMKRIEALAGGTEIDPARLAQEAAILADRSDVTEEVVRLESHLAQARALVEGEPDQPVGKRMDFLVQEILREVNTINSKSADLEISRTALDLKTETEKVREQIQNLE